jgi:hypothetical protein
LESKVEAVQTMKILSYENADWSLQHELDSICAEERLYKYLPLKSAIKILYSMLFSMREVI